MSKLRLMEFMYLVFVGMSGESYGGRSGSFLLCSCDIFRAIINSLPPPPPIFFFFSFFPFNFAWSKVLQTDKCVLLRTALVSVDCFRMMPLRKQYKLFGWETICFSSNNHGHRFLLLLLLLSLSLPPRLSL